MLKFTLIHPDESASHEKVVAVVHDYDSEIKILDGGIGSVDVEMTQQQHDDFLMINGNWGSKPIAEPAYADVNRPAYNLDNIRKALHRAGNAPS